MEAHRKEARCKHEGCVHSAVTLSDHCWEHLRDRKDYLERLAEVASTGAGLKNFNLQKVVLKEIHLTKVNFHGANLAQADLTGASLCDSNFERSDLIGTNLAGADLTNCDFKHADLTSANLSGARLWNSDLECSNLTEADVSGADLWNAAFFDAKLWRTVITGAKSLTKRSFFEKKAGRVFFDDPRINETGVYSAEESYRNIKNYFMSNGMYEDARWASYKEKAMERAVLKKKAEWGYIPSLAMDILCGYGEKPSRIILSAAGAILIYAALYSGLNAVAGSISPERAMSWVDYIYYSTITFTTTGYGDFLPKPVPLFRMLAASEAFLGTFLTGLFIFTLARKYSAR